MMKPFLLFALAFGSAAPVAAASGRAMPSQRIYGHWQVVGVAVSDGGVQALATNDPSYMGRRLTFTPARLSWDKPKDMSTEAPCAAPKIGEAARDADPDARALVRRIGGPATGAIPIGCATGSWGPATPPAPTIVTLRDGTIGLWWYDGGLLKLRRVG